jgi:hypothetical protein
MEFRTTKHYKPNLQIQHNQNYITNASETKFLGLIIDDTLTCSQHILQLTKKMSSACYALRQVKHSLPTQTLKIIYSAHVHCIMSYGVIFWSTASGANKVFIMQKKTSALWPMQDLENLVGNFLGGCKYLPFIPSTYTLYYYSQSIINIYLLQKMKFMNITHVTSTTFTPHWQT